MVRYVEWGKEHYSTENFLRRSNERDCANQNFPYSRNRSRVNVILLEDMENLGSKGEEVSVAAGLHRNFLYPKKKAVYSTTENKKRFLVKDTQVRHFMTRTI